MKKKSFKKILFEAIKWLAVYIFLVVFIYYDSSPSLKHYSWLIAAIGLSLGCLLYQLAKKKKILRSVSDGSRGDAGDAYCPRQHGTDAQTGRSHERTGKEPRQCPIKPSFVLSLSPEGEEAF